MIENIGLYRMFYEVACCGSISEAAQKLFVTQPAVSAAIKQLEGALETSLFFRTNRGIRLTPEGEILFDYVKAALASFETGEDTLKNISGLTSGVLRVGASDMTLRFYLLDAIVPFHKAYPHVKLNISNAPTPRTLEALQRGEIDFGVISEPVEAGPEIGLIRVKEIRDIVVTDDDRYGDRPVEYEEIAGEPLIMLERGTSTRRYIESQLTENGAPDCMLEPDIELATSDLMIDFAKRGMGCAFVVEDFAREGLKAGTLHEVHLRQPIKKRHFLLAYLKKAPHPAAARVFLAGLGLDLTDFR